MYISRGALKWMRLREGGVSGMYNNNNNPGEIGSHRSNNNSRCCFSRTNGKWRTKTALVEVAKPNVKNWQDSSIGQYGQCLRRACSSRRMSGTLYLSDLALCEELTWAGTRRIRRIEWPHRNGSEDYHRGSQQPDRFQHHGYRQSKGHVGYVEENLLRSWPKELCIRSYKRYSTTLVSTSQKDMTSPW